MAFGRGKPKGTAPAGTFGSGQAVKGPNRYSTGVVDSTTYVDRESRCCCCQVARVVSPAAVAFGKGLLAAAVCLCLGSRHVYNGLLQHLCSCWAARLLCSLLPCSCPDPPGQTNREQ